MNTICFDIGNWHVECQPEDGARISVLQFSGYNLLTPAPAKFKAPAGDYGEYETRPVYGYDDCFPTVEECIYPGEDFMLKDHGDVCWQEWEVKQDGNKLVCSTDLSRPELRMKRVLEFDNNVLSWQFSVSNRSVKPLSFLHVMHPLMPLAEIDSIEISGFGEIYSDTGSTVLNLGDSAELNRHLKGIKPGSFEMLFIRDVLDGLARIRFKNGPEIRIDYDILQFPTTGIWWNNGGYPDEPGIRRTEFAIEPVPGTCSNLEKSVKDGFSQLVRPGEEINWTINWTVE
jgi:hypothetical protein